MYPMAEGRGAKEPMGVGLAFIQAHSKDNESTCSNGIHAYMEVKLL